VKLYLREKVVSSEDKRLRLDFTNRVSRTLDSDLTGLISQLTLVSKKVRQGKKGERKKRKTKGEGPRTRRCAVFQRLPITTRRVV
jgi:hypothetical protein